MDFLPPFALIGSSRRLVAASSSNPGTIGASSSDLAVAVHLRILDLGAWHATRLIVARKQYTLVACTA
eukprot:3323840-Ditylum_brightwellii.AAC.2